MTTTGMPTADNTPKIPDAAWLEARFGEDSLWRPAEADLPKELSHGTSREFLTTVGFPAVTIDLIDFDSTHLRDDDEPYPFDADELYGKRYPDDDSPPENFCFTIGTRFDQQLMLDAAVGDIDHYDPSGWDHGAGQQGTAASSLPALAVLLGLLVERRDALTSDDTETRDAAVADLRKRMGDVEPEVYDSSFWADVFEYLSE